MSAAGSGATSAAIARTRSAILDAVPSVMAYDHAATIPQIADAAEVARTTVYRLFANRGNLIELALLHSVDVTDQAIAAADPEYGDPDDALRRVVEAVIGVKDHAIFLHAHAAPHGLSTGPDFPWDPALDAMIKNGQHLGVFDTANTVTWIKQTFWALALAGCAAAHRAGHARDAGMHVVRTLSRGISAPPRRARR